MMTGGDQLAEVGGRAPNRRAAQIAEARPDLGFCEVGS
jgi:hypothetical protein